MATQGFELSEEEQRKFQAMAWGLREDADWNAIKAMVFTRGAFNMLFHPEDWKEAMVRRYGDVFSFHHSTRAPAEA